MFKYSKDGVSVTLILDTRNVKQSGKFPVKVRVSYARKSKYFSTSKDLTAEEWDKLPTAKTHALTDLREELSASFDLIKGYVRALTNEGDFSFSALSMRLRGGLIVSLNSAMKARIEQLRAEERYGNMQIYQCALKTLERYAGDNIPFAAVTAKWLQQYEQHERNRGLRQTTISMHLRQIRAVFSEAKRLGIIKPSADPFAKGKFTIQNGEGRKLALTLQQIKLLANYSGNATMERYRDFWLFIYLCNGINVADLMRLKYKNIFDGEICFVRHKTRNTTKTVKEIRATITPQMQEIINKYGNEYAPNAYIFPILKGDETEAQKDLRCVGFTYLMNHYTKKLGQMLGIGNVTTYTARHSFATVLKRSGANIAYISESLGHSNIKITENYLASFEKEERAKNALLLTNFD